jgi:hypothetical protein
MPKTCTAMLLILFLSSGASAAPWTSRSGEPDAPNVDASLTSERESRIAAIRKQKIEDAFASLHDAEIYGDEAYFNKAAFQSFGSRRAAALQFVCNYLKNPRHAVHGESLEQDMDFSVAKRVLRVLPAESAQFLRTLYNRGDTTTKGNIIMALGTMHDGQGHAIKSWLVNALQDKDVFEEKESVSVGWPLRICDLAYNQLVLRYLVKGGLRTLGNVHEIEARDRCIAMMLGLIQ